MVFLCNYKKRSALSITYDDKLYLSTYREIKHVIVVWEMNLLIHTIIAMF